MKKLKVFGSIGIIFVVGLGVAFTYLYRQVRNAFESPREYVPTRIYSGVSRVTPPQSRGLIERKLQSLGYSIQRAGNAIEFTLHSPNYPEYLLPEGHPTRKLLDQKLTLQFEGESESSPLESILSPMGPVNEFYLEPEFLSALSQKKDEAAPIQKDLIREVLKFEEFPPLIPEAVVAAEDQRFYEHFGIDPRGFVRALWINLKTLSLSHGGSTITQQLVKNLMERRNRNVFMKASELFIAPLIEILYTKEQIFERYLNEVFLGQIGPFEVRGFAEGAKFFFGKNVQDLNSGEISLLVGLIKGPGFYSPYRHYDRARVRQSYVLQRLKDTGKMTEAEVQQALDAPIRLVQPPTAGNRAPYFVDYVKAELVRLLEDRFNEDEIPELGFQVFTTLDLEMNLQAQTALEAGILKIEAKMGIEQKLQGALIALDHTQSEIRALIGGRNYSESNFNRALNMKRQVGSTFKPIVYASAFRQRFDQNGNAFTAAYPLLDRPWEWNYQKGMAPWKPKNYDPESLGWISIRTALSKSINTAAARLANQVGLEEIIDTAKELGIETPLDPIPALSLGGIELAPIEMLQVYGTFANQGESDRPRVIIGIQNADGSDFTRFESKPRARIDPGIADLMTDLLRGVFETGTAASASRLGFTRPAAGKTGTTNDYRDAWFAGYTPQLTAVVWVGMDQGALAGKGKLTGSSAGLPIWIDFMQSVLRFEPEIPFSESEHLIDFRLDQHTGQEAEAHCPESQVVTEKVIVGREPRKKTCADGFPAE